MFPIQSESDVSVDVAGHVGHQNECRWTEQDDDDGVDMSVIQHIIHEGEYLATPYGRSN